MSDDRNYSSFREDGKFSCPEWKWFEHNGWTLSDNGKRATKNGPGDFIYSAIPWYVSSENAHWVAYGTVNYDGTFEYETKVVGEEYQTCLLNVKKVVKNHRKQLM